MSERPSSSSVDSSRKQSLKRSTSESSTRTRLKRSHKKEQGEKTPNSPENIKSKRTRHERNTGDSSDGKGDMGSGTSGDDRTIAEKRAREAVSDDGGPVAHARAKRKKYHSIVPVEEAMAAKSTRRRSRARVEAPEVTSKISEIPNDDFGGSASSSKLPPISTDTAPTYVTYTPHVTTVGGWHVTPARKVPSTGSTRSSNPFPHHSPRHHHRAFQCQSPSIFHPSTTSWNSPSSDGNETFSSFSSESLGLSELSLNIEEAKVGRSEDSQPSGQLPTLLKSHLDLLRSLDESEEELRRDRSSLPLSHIPSTKGRLAGPTMLQMLKGEKSQITDSSSSEGGGSGSTPIASGLSAVGARSVHREVDRKSRREARRVFDDSGLEREGESDNDEDFELKISVARDMREAEGSNGGRSGSSAGSSGGGGYCGDLSFLSSEQYKLPPIYHSYSVDDPEIHGSPAGSSHTPSPRQQKAWTSVNKWSISPQYYPSSTLPFEDHRSEADSESSSQGSSIPQSTLPCSFQYARLPTLAQPIAIGALGSNFANLLGSDLNQGTSSRIDTDSTLDTSRLPRTTSSGFFFSSRSAFAPKHIPQTTN